MELIAEILDTPWIIASDWLGVTLAALTVVVTSTAGFNHLHTSLDRIFESSSPELGTAASVVLVFSWGAERTCVLPECQP